MNSIIPRESTIQGPIVDPLRTWIHLGSAIELCSPWGHVHPWWCWINPPWMQHGMLLLWRYIDSLGLHKSPMDQYCGMLSTNVDQRSSQHVCTVHQIPFYVGLCGPTMELIKNHLIKHWSTWNLATLVLTGFTLSWIHRCFLSTVRVHSGSNVKFCTQFSHVDPQCHVATSVAWEFAISGGINQNSNSSLKKTLLKG